MQMRGASRLDCRCVTRDSSVLVVNAGSSSVKFQTFGGQTGDSHGGSKGQIDGIGTLPKLHTEASDGALQINIYAIEQVSDVPAAMVAMGDWLHETRLSTLSPSVTVSFTAVLTTIGRLWSMRTF